MNSINIANYFYFKNSELSEIQLQILVYYSYAWYLILNKKKLFNECPQAGKHGPIFQSLYKFMKSKIFIENNKNINFELYSFLNKIYLIYAKYSGNDLDRISSSELPYKKAKEKYLFHEISDKDIIEWGEKDGK